MAGDIRYQILIDGAVDDQLTSELLECEVTESVRGETTFRIRFSIDISGNDISLLNDDRLVPGKDRKVSVLVSIDSVTSCIVHGLITDRRTELKEGGPGSLLEIAGKDRRIEMVRNADERGPLTGTAALIVVPILSRYNFVPDVEVGDSQVYSEATNTLNQAHSDLELVNKLAAEQGYEFWLEVTVSAALGGNVQLLETAHFKSSPPRGQGQPISAPVPLLAPTDSPKLKMNTGDGTSTLITFSSTRATEVPTKSGQVSRVNIDSGDLEHTSVDQPSSTPLGDPPPLPDHRRPLLTPGNAQDAQRRQDAALIDASWIIKATAETTAHAMGALLRPHDIVSVSGTGSVDDGDYFVWTVTHRIDPADHKMRCELRRNAVGTTS
jgi:hypothetical protein